MESALVMQEFHISITPVGHDVYLLRTEAVAPGVPLAETQVTWPVDDWLAQTAALFQDPLQTLLTHPAGAEAWPQPELTGDSAAIALGQTLYDHLFQGRIRDSWLAAQGVAHHRQQPLRLRLGFKDSRLQRLPWELLYGDDRPLATGMDITLCRYYQASGTADLAAMPPLAPASTPLNVLVVISAPDDQERLALSREIQQLMADLRSPAPSNGSLGLGAYPSGSRGQTLAINLRILEQPGRAELVQALEQGDFQVLHYAGHSDVSETGGDLFLVNRQTGLTEWLSGKDLAGLLVNNGIWLAVFNSCRGAYTPEDDAQSGWREQNLVQALVNRGLPGVIAMAERIPDDVAILFTQLLYRNLRQGYSVDVCLSRVRQGLMSAHRSNQPLWMLPLLYLRPGFDGYLYAREPHPPDSKALLKPLETALDQALFPPDYSTDPDISGLAQEVFAGHAAIASSQLSADALEVLDSQFQPAPDSSEDALDGLPSSTIIPPPSSQGAEELWAQQPPVTASEARPSEDSTPEPDWLRELDHPATDAALTEADSAILAHLVEQLSTSAEPSRQASHTADSPTTLLPQWGTSPSSFIPETPDLGLVSLSSLGVEPSPMPSGETVQPPPLPPVVSPSPATTPVKKSSRLPQGALWVGMGLVSLATGVGLAIALLLRQPPSSQPLPSLVRPPASGPSGDESPATTTLSGERNGVLVITAVQGLTTDNLAMARKFIEQLLDQGDLAAAQSVIAAAKPQQLMEPDLAFVRGRLAWQQITVGQSEASPNDALRDWSRSVQGRDNFLEAWVALGFAHYTLADYDLAIRAWEKALALDQKQLRDRDPEAQVQLSSRDTPNAIAGLVMALQQQSQQAIDPNEAQRIEERAQNYLVQVTSSDPTLLDPNVLARRWLWTPRLIQDWQTTVERLSVTHSSGVTGEQ